MRCSNAEKGEMSLRWHGTGRESGKLRLARIPKVKARLRQRGSLEEMIAVSAAGPLCKGTGKRFGVDRVQKDRRTVSAARRSGRIALSFGKANSLAGTVATSVVMDSEG